MGIDSTILFQLPRSITTLLADVVKQALPLPSPSFRAVFYARGLDNVVSVVVSCVWMKREEAIKAREQLVRRLPDASEILRGSLLHRKIFHRQGCSECR